jgi:hypothetical protein
MQCFPLPTLILACGVIGCDGGTSGAGLVPVSGQVTLDGEPLAGAQVIYIPARQDGQAVTATATTDNRGNYSLLTNIGPGAMPGAYRVIVSKYVGSDDKPISQSLEGASPTHVMDSSKAKQALPSRYSDSEQTELQLEVVASGDNKHKLELTK